VESLGEADLLPFHELLDAAMVDEALKAEKVWFIDCIYAPIVTLCRFLSQVWEPGVKLGFLFLSFLGGAPRSSGTRVGKGVILLQRTGGQT
ncbi:MAG: hypothetical protein ACLQGP_02190, partial [Isosphaeraceae bacterium]